MLAYCTKGHTTAQDVVCECTTMYTSKLAQSLSTSPPAAHQSFICLAGASLTASYSGTIEQEAVSTDSQTYQITVNGGLTGSAADDLTYTIMLAYFGSNLSSAVSSGIAYPLVAALPADGCSPLRYANSLPGKVVLLQRGNCTFQTKVQPAAVCL